MVEHLGMAAQHTKVLVDSRMRDIRRRVEVIQKKLADLQEMGVPCAFCYSSVRNTGSIFTLGDKRITDVIEQHRNEILCNLMEGGNQAEADLVSNPQEIHLILPVLPSPLDELGRTTLQSMIVGILKDLGIRWTDPKPVWWPEDIPFVPPRSAPESFAGNWIHALKRVLESVYSYFSYDTNSYIASKLESHKNGVVNWDGLVVREGNLHGGHQQDEDTDEEDKDTDETDDEGCDDEPDQRMRENSVEFDSKPVERVSYVATTAGGGASTTSKPPTKLVSSFTVENILMGRQRSFCSSSSSGSSTGRSSGSAAAAVAPVHSPTSNSRPVTTSNHAMLSCTSSTSSSIVGVNWVSHPPVKYTKFTMLSPTAMSDEAQKKKKLTYDHPAVLNPKSFRAVCESQEFSLTKREDVPAPSPTPQVTCAQSVSSNRIREAVTTTASSSSAIQVYPIASLKELPASSSSLSTTTARLCTLPVVSTLPAITSLDRKSVMSKGFPPSQQYVFIVPSNSVAVTPSIQHSVTDNNDSIRRTIKPVIMGNNDTTASIIRTCQPLAVSSRKSTIDSTMEKTAPSTNVLSDSNNNFRLIAPKNSLPSSTSQDRSMSKSKILKRTSQKPHKLRFHMTTVVTKQKREPVRGSMTVESPSAVVSDVTETRSASPHSNQGDTSDRTVAVESTITRSPNMYSAETKSSPNVRSDGVMESVRVSEEKQEEMEEVGMDSLTRKEASNQQSLKRMGEEDPSLSSVEHLSEPRAKGRATRNYTRRKRELTFHLYEDPETAFRVKKACKD